ncbi:GspH/FimT family pseudopilin [Bradyrhizobium lablabi]|jgi:general secretion pathway protein H|uniref:GspH/FimT family pseudopilin n=1 Tax=Bradyrhizobium lablabi TaxID=722472 RepID=UPI00090A8854|nr:GspH/FimT family pseudopilin [Bradyrhizobium lablabi]SHK63055.1 general secretion pathway protein H [Bradyrhizobium lablabi]
MRRGNNPSAGFTLVELLVVMGIMAVVLVVVLNARPKAAATRVAVTARAVGATLQLARAQAMQSNTETLFRIDTDRLRFGLPRSMHSLPRGMTVAMTVAETERVGDAGGIRFFPDGQSSGGEISLTLEGRSARIAVNWLTGKAQLNR